MSTLNKEFYNNNETNWNGQIVNNFTESIDKINKMSPSINLKEKSGNIGAFNTSSINSNNLIKTLSDSESNQINQNEGIDFTTLHNNEVISLADLDTTNQNNTKASVKNVPSFQFNSPLNSSSNHSSLNSSSNNQFDKPTINYQPKIDTQQSNVDDGLTNLSWLQNLNMCRLGAPTPPASPLCNLTPTYFSGISPQTNQQHLQTAYRNAQFVPKASKPVKQAKQSERKSKISKQNGSKSKNQNKKMNKSTNRQTNNQLSNTNQSDLNTAIRSTTNSQTDTKFKKEVQTNEYVEMNNSLDLLYNGDHPMLNSDAFCTSFNANELSSHLDLNLRLDSACSNRVLEPLNDLKDENQQLNEFADNNQTDEKIDYKTNATIKPPFSYSNLICMAMKSNRNKMTLKSIYVWIRENFLYYRNAQPRWQNSIRHNLSLNKFFIRIARTKEEPGKGGFWKLDPSYAENLVNGVFKKRKPIKTELNALKHNNQSEKRKRKKEKGKKSNSANQPQQQQIVDYGSQQTITTVCNIGDNLVMHDTPPNSAESYSGFIENPADLEIASAVNSIDLINGNHTMHHQPSTYNLNSTSINSQTKQLNSISNDNNSHLQSVHLVNNSNDHLNTVSSLTSSNLTHQLVVNQNPNHSSNHHYMIHVTNTNNQESQITVEPMSNNVQQMHSNTSACAFSNDITQLTNLNASNGVLNLDSSNINLTTLSNGQLNDLLTSDNDICWNSLLTDELRLVDSIGTYATNTTVTTSNQTQIVHNPVLDTQPNPICSINSSISAPMNGSINGSLTNTISNPISNSLQVNSSNLLTSDAQLNQNLILNSTTNQTSTNNSFIANSNAFTNQIDNNHLDNQLHLNGSSVVAPHSNVVTCVNQTSSANSTTINSSINSNWDANSNYMNLTYNRLNGHLTNQTPNDLNSSSLNDNQNSPIVIQINSNGLSSDLNGNCNHFDSSNSIPAWIECTLQSGKAFEASNAFDLDSFSELDNCTTY